MNEELLKKLFQGIRDETISIEEGIQNINKLTYEDLGFVKIDYHRAIRQGFSEVIYCASKTPDQVAIIAEKLAQREEGNVLATRASSDVLKQLLRRFRMLSITLYRVLLRFKGVNRFCQS